MLDYILLYYLINWELSLSGSSPLCVITISNIKRYRVGASKHNTLLRCKVSQGRRHVSALYYKAIIRSDMVKTKEENYNVTYFLFSFHHVRPDDGLIVKGRNMSSTL